jgi:hypothetical protein
VVTREMVRDWLLAYLNAEIERAVLVDWARQVKQEGQIFGQDVDVVGPALARIGLTGVGGYDLTWDDCFDLLESLGFVPQVIAEPAEEFKG